MTPPSSSRDADDAARYRAIRAARVGSHGHCEIWNVAYVRQQLDDAIDCVRGAVKAPAPHPDEPYKTVMTRIEQLMLSDPAKDSPDGAELSLLADVAVFYERRRFPQFTGAVKCWACDDNWPLDGEWHRMGGMQTICKKSLPQAPGGEKR